MTDMSQGPIEGIESWELRLVDKEENPGARVLMGSTRVLGVWFHVLAVQVEGGLHGNTYQHAVCDPYNRLRDINALNDLYLETVEIPGHEGEWALAIYPHGRG